MKSIGFIGVGVMGKAMARNLMAKGYDVSVYSRTKSKIEDILKEGALWAATPADCAQGKDCVMTMVGFPVDVEEVYFGANGIMSVAQAGMTLIDFTTTSPKLSERIYAEAKKAGAAALDAPVTGGDVGAKKATLTILVGGDKEVFDACKELFEALGNNIVYVGGAGSGQHMKMVNQILIAGAVSGLAEAFTYAKKVGIEPADVVAALGSGAASSFQLLNTGPRMIKEDYAPGFYMKHFIKDMLIAQEEAQQRGVTLKVLSDVIAMYKELEQRGLGDEGTQSIIKYYD